MFIKRIEQGGKLFYYVYEVYRPQEGAPQSSRIIATLGHEKSLKAAYQKELEKLKKSQEKIAGLEKAIAVMGEDARYRGRYDNTTLPE